MPWLPRRAISPEMSQRPAEQRQIKHAQCWQTAGIADVGIDKVPSLFTGMGPVAVIYMPMPSCFTSCQLYDAYYKS